MRRICAFLLLSITPLGLFAQGRLVGRVTEAGKGLEFVNVGIVSIDRPVGTVTDAKGRYDVVVPTEDSVVVRFSMAGYSSKEFKVKVLSGMTLTLDCQLQPGTMLEEVRVTDNKVRHTTFTQIDVEKLESTVGPNGGVESLLKTLPDVASNNELSSQFNVRGGSFDENLVYINDVEVTRPMLIRSGEQEGLSIINPDMVDHLLFSPGGFDATYGDRMSSALDITYSRPREFKAKASASLLGASLGVQGLLGNRWTYSLGARKHTNSYIFKSLDTDGDYTTDYTDVQSVVSYKASDKLDISFLGVVTHNDYGVVPSDRKTEFGNMMEPLQLDIYFEGQEVDSYTTRLGAITFDYRPTDFWQIRWITSMQANTERETYDILSQYWLREAHVVDDTLFDRGVGSFLEHARNYINTNIFSTEVKATNYAALGNWNMGLKFQHESIDASMREWRYVDSSGYSMPTSLPSWGDPANMPVPPVLQNFNSAANQVSISRLQGYVQREVDFNLGHDAELGFVLGLRGHLYDIAFSNLDSANNTKFLVSPRFSAHYRPDWKQDMLFRLAAGIYNQAPLYREYQYATGELNTHVDAQHSYQVAGTMDWNVRMWGKPFKLTADLYYKYVPNLIPFTVDNLRIRYDAENDARGYATGVSFRLNGELVEGLESWASLSLMKAREDIEGDGLGWIDRATDQRWSFKVFVQDFVPDFPFWRMNLSLIASDGTPVLRPNQTSRRQQARLPAYFRVDWGNTIQLSRFEKLSHWRLFDVVEDVQIGVEVFNLFNYHNVVSYLWVSDIDNQYYAVPNYLTARQVNLKLTVVF